MQLGNNDLKKITNMNDKELRELISSVAREKGLNLPNISEVDLAKIRTAMSQMSAADVEKIKNSFNGGGKI